MQVDVKAHLNIQVLTAEKPDTPSEDTHLQQLNPSLLSDLLTDCTTILYPSKFYPDPNLQMTVTKSIRDFDKLIDK